MLAIRTHSLRATDTRVLFIARLAHALRALVGVRTCRAQALCTTRAIVLDGTVDARALASGWLVSRGLALLADAVGAVVGSIALNTRVLFGSVGKRARTALLDITTIADGAHGAVSARALLRCQIVGACRTDEALGHAGSLGVVVRLACRANTLHTLVASLAGDALRFACCRLVFASSARHTRGHSSCASIGRRCAILAVATSTVGAGGTHGTLRRTGQRIVSLFARRLHTIRAGIARFASGTHGIGCAH